MNHRLPALDWLRGIVMVLMAGDHASEAFNALRPTGDGAMMPGFDQPLDPLQFFFRWTSHLCAPVFLLLAGTSLALSVERRLRRGASAWSIDRDLLLRALVLFAVEAFFINWFWAPGVLILQVLFAIGASMLLMIVLRRLPAALLWVFVAACWIGGEWTMTGAIYSPNDPVSVLRSALFNGAYFVVELFNQTGVMLAYPILPWCGTMVLGWLFGRYLSREESGARSSLPRTLILVGLVLLACFALLRGANGFGNLRLYRLDASLVQWLHVSKYPPSLSFSCLELGIAAIVLAGLLRVAQKGPIRDKAPLLVFGQVPFFFYVAHIFLLEIAARGLGMYQTAGLREACIACLAALLVLYPLCLGYRACKRRDRTGLLRYF